MGESKHDQPIPGPEHVGPDFITEPDYGRAESPSLYLGRKLLALVKGPAMWIRENIVEPNRGPKYYWYHRKFGRAVPVDECYLDDQACIYEAHLEYERNQLVDRLTLELLMHRRDNCHLWWAPTKGHVNHLPEECKDIDQTYDREQDNFFIKYGDMHHGITVMHAYNKQKHRMIMERRRAIAAKEREKEMEMVSGAS